MGQVSDGRSTFYALETKVQNPKTGNVSDWEAAGLGRWAGKTEAVDTAKRFNALWANSRARVLEYQSTVVYEDTANAID